jgi:hypothetical protein
MMCMHFRDYQHPSLELQDVLHHHLSVCYCSAALKPLAGSLYLCQWKVRLSVIYLFVELCRGNVLYIIITVGYRQYPQSNKYVFVCLLN